MIWAIIRGAIIWGLLCTTLVLMFGWGWGILAYIAIWSIVNRDFYPRLYYILRRLGWDGIKAVFSGRVEFHKARRLTPDNIAAITKWVHSKGFETRPHEDGLAIMLNPNLRVVARHGDWIMHQNRTPTWNVYDDTGLLRMYEVGT